MPVPRQRAIVLAAVKTKPSAALNRATAETWLGPERTRSGEEAVLTIGVSHHERMAVIRRIRRTPALAFGPAEWLPADALDDTYFRVLPSGQSTVTAEEAAMLEAVFADDGELPARPAGTSTWKQ